MQWTYGQTGTEWYLGLVTQKVTVTQVGTEQYYYNDEINTGETVKKDVSVSKVYKSKSFDSPWAKAWQYINYPDTEYIEWKVGNRTFMF